LTQFLLGPGHPLYGAVEERLNEKLAPLVGKSSLHVDAGTELSLRALRLSGGRPEGHSDL
jgi:hypothetical protein